MKKLIATAVIALATTSANAYDSHFDPEEFYSGSEVAPRTTVLADNFNPELYVEGHFPIIDWSNRISGPELGEVEIPSDLYMEGNFPS